MVAEFQKVVEQKEIPDFNALGVSASDEIKRLLAEEYLEKAFEVIKNVHTLDKKAA